MFSTPAFWHAPMLTARNPRPLATDGFHTIENTHILGESVGRTGVGDTSSGAPVVQIIAPDNYFVNPPLPVTRSSINAAAAS